MIWVIAIAAFAACPIAFSGLWTRRWFRVLVYFIVFIVVGAILHRQ